MHITSDRVSFEKAMKTISDYVILDHVYIFNDERGFSIYLVKKPLTIEKIGTLEPSTIYNDLFTLKCDLPRKPVKKWKYDHFSFNRDLEPDEIAALV